MTRTVLCLLAVACSDPDAGNPDKLWLALMGSERVVQLLPAEPEPF